MHLSVTFHLDSYDTLHPFIETCLPAVQQSGVKEAAWFLSQLRARSGELTGTKGGVCNWGMVGNYTNVEDFVRVLAPFWFLLLGATVSAPHERVMVFSQGEQDETAQAFEIFREDPCDEQSMTVKKHNCPFAWFGQ